METGVAKAEMRGHENVLEVAVFVPPVSLPAIRDLVARVSHRTESLLYALL